MKRHLECNFDRTGAVGSIEAVAERAAQPPNFFDNAAGFRARLERDISAKARVLARLKARPPSK